MRDHRDYPTWEPQIRRAAPRFLRRAHAAGARTLLLEDVVSELTVAWCIARDRFDPTLGVPFAAYLARGMQNHINRFVDEQIGEASGHFSLDTNEANEDGSEAHEWAVADPGVRPDEALEEKDILDRVKSELSPDAAKFLELLASPPPALFEEMQAIQARAENGRARGHAASPAPKAITGGLILDLMGMERTDRNRIYRELREIASVMNLEVTQ